MADGSLHRTVTVERITQGVFTKANTHGGQLRFGTAAIPTSPRPNCCWPQSPVARRSTFNILTSRRAEPDRFQVRADADKIRDAGGNRLTGIQVIFQIAFPGGARGDEARAILPDAVRKSHDRLCTVGRTVETATPITTKIE